MPYKSSQRVQIQKNQSNSVQLVWRQMFFTQQRRINGLIPRRVSQQPSMQRYRISFIHEERMATAHKTAQYASHERQLTWNGFQCHETDLMPNADRALSTLKPRRGSIM